MPNIVIIGGGPAGLSAAIYAVRAGMQATVLYKDGGALAKTDKIENYFGFIEPVSGAELLERGQKQVERLGAVLRQTEVTGIEYAAQGFTVKTADGVFDADAVILATGSPRAVPKIAASATAPSVTRFSIAARTLPCSVRVSMRSRKRGCCCQWHSPLRC